MSTHPTPRPVLHHVTLKTNRVEEMVKWYVTVVGMTTNHHSRFGAWMTNDGANHRVALLAHPALSDDPEKIPHTGIHHMAFEYAGIGDLLDSYVRLRGDGIVPHACLDHGMTTSLYYVDPDGNSVELQADNFGDWSASSEWMRTAPEFEVNPIGINVDPERLLAAWREGGEDAAGLHRRSFAASSTRGPRWTCACRPRPLRWRERIRRQGVTTRTGIAPLSAESRSRVDRVGHAVRRQGGR